MKNQSNHGLSFILILIITVTFYFLLSGCSSTDREYMVREVSTIGNPVVIEALVYDNERSVYVFKYVVVPRTSVSENAIRRGL